MHKTVLFSICRYCIFLLIALDIQHCGKKIKDSQSICSTLHDFGFLMVANYGKAKQNIGTIIQNKSCMYIKHWIYSA